MCIKRWIVWYWHCFVVFLSSLICWCYFPEVFTGNLQNKSHGSDFMLIPHSSVLQPVSITSPLQLIRGRNVRSGVISTGLTGKKTTTTHKRREFTTNHHISLWSIKTFDLLHPQLPEEGFIFYAEKRKKTLEWIWIEIISVISTCTLNQTSIGSWLLNCLVWRLINWYIIFISALNEMTSPGSLKPIRAQTSKQETFVSLQLEETKPELKGHTHTAVTGCLCCLVLCNCVGEQTVLPPRGKTCCI